MNPRLQILHRPGCHLCDEMLSRVQNLAAGRAVDIETTDIEQDSDLLAEFGLDVPVLFGNGIEICRHRLDEMGLEDFLSGI